MHVNTHTYIYIYLSTYCFIVHIYICVCVYTCADFQTNPIRDPPSHLFSSKLAGCARRAARLFRLRLRPESAAKATELAPSCRNRVLKQDIPGLSIGSSCKIHILWSYGWDMLGYWWILTIGIWLFFLGWDILRYYGYKVYSYYVIIITTNYIYWHLNMKWKTYNWMFHRVNSVVSRSPLFWNSICPSLLLSYRYFVCYYFDCCYLYLKFQLICKKTTSRAFIRLHHPKYHQPAMGHGNRFLLGSMAHVCSRMLMKTILW